MAELVRRGRCPVCSGTNVSLRLELPFSDPRFKKYLDQFFSSEVPHSAIVDGAYRIVECHDCDCVYQDDILDDAGMVELYDVWASAEISLGKKAEAPATFFKTYTDDLVLIEQVLGRPSHQIDLMDFGMGWGFWARMAQALNFRVVGAELSANRIEHARQFGLNVVGDVRELPAESFDAIFADQVIEHLPEPSAVMKEFARLLRPDGLVLIKVPNDRGVLDNLTSPAFKPRHDALDPLQHINMFRRRTFDRFGEIAGLRQIEIPITANPLDIWSWLRQMRGGFRNRWHQGTALYRK
jgi:SAM-dependent methyltransferase